MSFFKDHANYTKFHMQQLHNTNYLWLPSITFIKCSPITWRSHQCAHDVEQFFLLLNSVHTCYESPSQMTSWLKCPQNIMHPNLHPI